MKGWLWIDGTRDTRVVLPRDLRGRLRAGHEHLIRRDVETDNDVVLQLLPDIEKPLINLIEKPFVLVLLEEVGLVIGGLPVIDDVGEADIAFGLGVKHLQIFLAARRHPSGRLDMTRILL